MNLNPYGGPAYIAGLFTHQKIEITELYCFFSIPAFLWKTGYSFKVPDFTGEALLPILNPYF